MPGHSRLIATSPDRTRRPTLSRRLDRPAVSSLAGAARQPSVFGDIHATVKMLLEMRSANKDVIFDKWREVLQDRQIGGSRLARDVMGKMEFDTHDAMALKQFLSWVDERKSIRSVEEIKSLGTTILDSIRRCGKYPPPPPPQKGGSGPSKLRPLVWK